MARKLTIITTIAAIAIVGAYFSFINISNNSYSDLDTENKSIPGASDNQNNASSARELARAHYLRYLYSEPQEYKNEKYGFKFKYPKEWVAQQKSETHIDFNYDGGTPARLEIKGGWDEFKIDRYVADSGEVWATFSYDQKTDAWFFKSKTGEVLAPIYQPKIILTDSGIKVYLTGVGEIPMPVYIIPLPNDYVLRFATGDMILPDYLIKSFSSL